MCELTDRARREGIEEGILKVAKAMKEDNTNLEMIVKFTGLSKEQIALL